MILTENSLINYFEMDQFLSIFKDQYFIDFCLNIYSFIQYIYYILKYYFVKSNMDNLQSRNVFDLKINEIL